MASTSRRVTFTLDVEDYVAGGTAPRAPGVTRGCIAFLARRGVRGTFFVVGELAENEPELVRDDRGGGARGRVARLPARAAHRSHPGPVPRGDSKRGKALLEDLVGAEVAGFRAPTFSLVPSTEWATDILPELGFRYSSSVLPARSPLFGWPGRPRVPTRWPSGLLELPCPVTQVGPGTHPYLANPYLGGVYFRVLPWSAVRYGMRHVAARRGAVDVLPPVRLRSRRAVRRCGPASAHGKSRLLWLNRRRMFDRIGRLFDRRHRVAAGRTHRDSVTVPSD